LSPVIDIRLVGFSYGSLPMLSGIDLKVEDGEFLGVLGPNTGDKSRRMKPILGFPQPQSGRFRVLGRSPRTSNLWLGHVPRYPSSPRDFPTMVDQVVLPIRVVGLKPVLMPPAAVAGRYVDALDRMMLGAVPSTAGRTNRHPARRRGICRVRRGFSDSRSPLCTSGLRAGPDSRRAP